jgi:hypothetical protein
MSEEFDPFPEPDVSRFNDNQRKFPQDVSKYAGECVAWSPDGLTLLAHGKTFEEALALLKAAGHNPSAVVWDDVPPDQDGFLGAGAELTDAKIRMTSLNEVREKLGQYGLTLRAD